MGFRFFMVCTLYVDSTHNIVLSRPSYSISYYNSNVSRVYQSIRHMLKNLIWNVYASSSWPHHHIRTWPYSWASSSRLLLEVFQSFFCEFLALSILTAITYSYLLQRLYQLLNLFGVGVHLAPHFGQGHSVNFVAPHLGHFNCPPPSWRGSVPSGTG